LVAWTPKRERDKPQREVKKRRLNLQNTEFMSPMPSKRKINGKKIKNKNMRSSMSNPTSLRKRINRKPMKRRS
jgi:hypothetical protein